jgi:hypothetical protein
MTPDTTSTPNPSLRGDAGLAFAPIHKRALGTAVGLVAAVSVFVVTVWSMAMPDPPALIYLLRYLLPGHDVSWSGAVIGALSAGFAFFVAAWFLAFCRNFVLAASIWLVRTRNELEQTRDFLDHI